MAGIYLHIPFCKKLCSYCDFYHIISVNDYSPFLNALLQETSMRKEYLDKESVSTIYLGGGTPSVLTIKEIATILERIYKVFNVTGDCEITIELNPDDVQPSYLKGLKDISINRVSLGIQ